MIIISATAVLYLALHQPDESAPSFQLIDVIISKPTIEDANHLVFYGTVKDACSLYYTASIPVTYHLTIHNPNSPTKSANLTRFINDSEIIENLNIPPYATYQRSYDLLKGQTFSGLLSISGGENDLHLYINYHNYTQSVDFSFNLINSGSSDGYAVVEFRSDRTVVWSNRYYLEVGGNERDTRTITIPDKEDHTFQLVVVQEEE